MSDDLVVMAIAMAPLEKNASREKSLVAANLIFTRGGGGDVNAIKRNLLVHSVNYSHNYKPDQTTNTFSHSSR